MKRFIMTVAAAALMASSVVHAESAGIGTYSEGYRMGQLSKFSVKGMMFKSGEGQMLLGRESSPYIVDRPCGDNSTCKDTINPWYFSAEPNMSNKINSLSGEYVFIRYNQAQIQSPAYDTDYMVVDIQPVTRESITKTCVDEKAGGNMSEGFRVGRIVKASSKGHLSKSYEVMIQVGNAGNQFKHMSVISPEMYSCAVEVLKSAQKVKIQYKESFVHNPFGQDTSYNLYKIEPISDI